MAWFASKSDGGILEGPARGEKLKPIDFPYKEHIGHQASHRIGKMLDGEIYCQTGSPIDQQVWYQLVRQLAQETGDA